MVISYMQKLKTSILHDRSKGALVALKDSTEFGTVVEIEKKWGHEGAWIMWTHTGRLAWSPIACLDFLCEETDKSVDEHLNA